MKPETEEQDTFDAIIAAIDAIEPEPDRHLAIQIDEACRDAIQAAQASNQKATVTIKVHVHPKQERRIVFAATVDTKLPRPPVSAATLFADANGVLHKSDPAQARLFNDDTRIRTPKDN